MFMCIQVFFFYFVPCPPDIKLVLHDIRERSFSSAMQNKLNLRGARSKFTKNKSFI